MLILLSNLFPAVYFGAFNKCYYQNSSGIIVQIT